MRVGILGGAFDPIHSGHLDLAARAKAELGLDEVLVLPSGKPGYKALRARRADRLKMVEIACRDLAGLSPCDVEINRKGKTYTVDTLKALREARPGDSFVYILGVDALSALDHWRGVDEIGRYAEFVVAGRPGWDPDAARAEAGRIGGTHGIAIAVTDLVGLDISSGMVRDRVALGESIDDLVPPGVADYIRREGLYLCAYRESEILDKLKGAITVHRYHHTLGVADTAERLAARFGVDPKRARLAGLLHDCAKSLPYGEMRKLVSENVPDTDEAELDAEPVLHAPAGMVLAARDYGVRDPAILQAIRRHTLGGPDMTAMDALIYVSDFIEPGRRPFPGLQDVREAAETDIFRAMRMSAKLSSDYLISRGQSPHPRTMQLLKMEEN